MTDVNPPIGSISSINVSLDSPQGRQSLLILLDQMWRRMGGGDDLIDGLNSLAGTNFYAAGITQEQEYGFDLFPQIFEDEMLRGEQSPVGTNSTTSTLAGGATFTGTAEQNDYPDVMCSCYADVAGTLYFDFSVNGTDWRTFPTNGFAVSAGVHEFHTAVKGPRYFRVRFVNGASAQSTFQLFIYYGKFRTSNAPLNQPYSLDSDSILTRQTIPWLDISRGLVSGMTVVKNFGRNESVGTTYAPLTFGGEYRTPQSGSATALRIKSGGNANDTAAGTGAREVTLEGLDENFALATEAVATAGSSASSATTTTFTRLFRAYVSASGAYADTGSGSHAGDITIEDSGGTEDWCVIDSTNYPKSQSEIGFYSVPSGKTAYVFLDDVTVDSGKTVDVVFFHRGNIDETSAPFTAMRAQSVLTGITGGTTDLSGRQVPLGPFTGPADIGFMARVGATTGAVSCEFEIFLVDE